MRIGRLTCQQMMCGLWRPTRAVVRAGSYYNMLSFIIQRYICMLTVLFGAGCGHLIEVQGVFQVFADKSAVYELMTGDDERAGGRDFVADLH